MFKPGKIIKGYPDEVYNTPNYKYVMNTDDLANVYKSYCNYDPKTSSVNLFKFKAIGDDGNVQPLKKWVLKAGYDILSDTN